MECDGVDARVRETCQGVIAGCQNAINKIKSLRLEEDECNTYIAMAESLQRQAESVEKTWIITRGAPLPPSRRNMLLTKTLGLVQDAEAQYAVSEVMRMLEDAKNGKDDEDGAGVKDDQSMLTLRCPAPASWSEEDGSMAHVEGCGLQKLHVGEMK